MIEFREVRHNVASLKDNCVLSLMLGCFLFQSSLIALVEPKEDFSDLAPNQRRKKLQQRLDEINTRLLQETATRDGLMKMKGVYEQNRALGDPLSIEGQLTESGQRYFNPSIDRFRI